MPAAAMCSGFSTANVCRSLIGGHRLNLAMDCIYSKSMDPFTTRVNNVLDFVRPRSWNNHHSVSQA